MCNISIDEKKAEAVARMKSLGLSEQIIKQFNKRGKISLYDSKTQTFRCINGLDLGRVKDFEQQNKALVFVVIRSYTSFGLLDSYIFVSDYLQDWMGERESLREWEATAYVYNHDDPDLSEIGLIGIAPTFTAGLNRIW